MSSPRSSEFIPNEIFFEIFLFLPNSDIFSITLTCKRFHTLMSTNQFWKRKCLGIPKIREFIEKQTSLMKGDLEIENSSSSTQHLEVDWKTTFIEISKISSFMKIDEHLMKIEPNPDYNVSSDGDGDDYRFRVSSIEGEPSFSFGNFSHGKWYFEFQIKKLNWACSIGWCHPSMPINQDSEYQYMFVGMYDGGTSGSGNPNFCCFNRRIKNSWDTRGMKVDDHVGTYIDFQKKRVIGYYKIKSEGRRTIRKIFYVCNLVEELKKIDGGDGRDYYLDENSEKGRKEFGDLIRNEDEKLVLSAHIWFHKPKDVALFNFPKVADQKFVDSFKLESGEENQFSEFMKVVEFKEEYFM